MSVYIPNPIYLRVEMKPDGHWVCDEFGAYDGPYACSMDAWSIIHDLEREYRQDEALSRQGKSEP